MTLEERIKVLIHLGEYLKNPDEDIKAVLHQTKIHNQWFTIENIEKALEAISSSFLVKEKLKHWTRNYKLENSKQKNVGLILAGNIPLVGFHDFLCVFIAGHRAMIKLSDKDKFILPHLVKIMTQFDTRCGEVISFIDRLNDFDAVIATGSNNTSRYFEVYFGKHPNIIRKNRNAIAVLNGDETEEELRALGLDIFTYFGLGCRNVSKIYVKEGYNFEPLLEILHEHKGLAMHNKYKNNFDYNFTLLILNGKEHLNNGCILLSEEEEIQSRIASLNYEYFNDKEKLESDLTNKLHEIQCVVSNLSFESIETIPFGTAQKPTLSEYADGVDTLAFLSGL